MRAILIAATVFLAALLAEGINPQEFLPEENNGTEAPIAYETGITTGVVYTDRNVTDSNYTVGYDLYGDLNNSSEINGSLVSDMLKLSKERGAPSLELYNRMSKKAEYSSMSSSPSSFTEREVINSMDANSSLLRGMKAVENVREAIRAAVQMPSRFIECYATRQLIPSFHCSLAEKEDTFFGGDAKTSQSQAMRDCTDFCSQEFECIGEDSGRNKIKVGFGTHDVIEGGSIHLPTEYNMKTKFVEFRIFTPIQHPTNETAPDLNLTEAEYSIRLDVNTTSSNGNTVQLLRKTRVRLSDVNITYRVYIDEVVDTVDFNLYVPLKENPDYNDANLTSVEITDIKMEFSDDKYYFCAQTQFESDASECGGVLKTFVDHSGIPRRVCVGDKNGNSGPELVYGAYYEKSFCDSKCVVPAECTPTYANFTSGADTYFNVEVGCVDSDTNGQCSQQRCEDLFRYSNKIVEEKNYVNDSGFETTILSGARTEAQRPRVDIDGELSGEDRDSLFNGQMKDAAYLYMTEKETFNVSRVPLSQPTAIMSTMSENALDGGGTSQKWLFKPSSVDYDGMTRYLYTIVQYEQIYTPAGGQYYSEGSVLTAQVNNRFKDVSYAILKPDGDFTVFRRELMKEMELITETNSTDSEGNPITARTSEWIFSPSTADDTYGFYNDNNSTWESYDTSMTAEYFNSLTFPKTRAHYSYTTVANSRQMIDLTPGLVMRDQNVTDNSANFVRLYTGAFNDANRGTLFNYKLYSFYSSERLDYAQVSNRLVEENRVYSLINKRLYLSKLKNDGQFNHNIGMFLQGPVNNMSAIMEVEPQTNEIGKKTFYFMFIY